ncbi:MAG: DUF2695 domain-containing protein [Terracidiphilus sp.]|jgi:hypothetical protein
MSDRQSDDSEYINDITPDVLGVLDRLHFFERLDDWFCPLENPERLVQCGARSFEISTKILRDLGMDSDDIADVLAVLHSRGACCDCEVLYNVAEESRLKARYWKARFAELQSDPTKHSTGGNSSAN